MKNLFKNLMLVAVAAMAFTACQNDNDFAGNAAGEGTTTISVVANLDDTRSAFTGEKGDTGYQSVWNGGEAVKAYVVSDGGYDNFYNVAESNEAAVEAENGATQAHFNLSFSSSLSNGALYIIAAADASVIGFDNPGWNYSGGQKPNITLPTEQTPGDNSVDPKAHVLIYENSDFRASQSTDIEATFKHYAAYGKLSLKNFTAEGVTSYVLNINDKVYTINSSKTENVWFACEPATVTNMTISVNAADGAYTKQIVENSNPSLEFVKGQVSTFTVNMEGVTSGEAVDTFSPTYRLESLSWSGSYFNLVTNYVGNGTPHSSNTTMNLRIYMHADDRPNNNSLKLGNYTCAATGAKDPSSAGTVNLRYTADSWWTNPTNANASSTLSVSAENGEYVIVATINGQTWGYKGLPDGWPAPVGGGDDSGDEPENPGEGGGDEPENPGEGGGDEPEVPGVEGFEPVTLVSLSQGYFSGRAYYFIAAFEFDYQGKTINVSIANADTINLTSNNPIPAATYNFVSDFNFENLYQNSISQVSVQGNTGTGGNVEVIKDGDIYTLKMTLEYTDPTLGAQTLKVYYHGAIK